MAVVDIVMSVYNGEKFLQEMLESIGAQDFTDWHLIVRNNGSVDRTLDIIERFSRKFENKVTVINSDANERFIPLSFGDALLHSKSQYVMYADGDDVWLSDKVSRAVDAIRQAEESYGKGVPVLVHTDLILVDETLNTISPSMWRSQALDPSRKGLNDVIMHSNACGNTFIFNKPLFELVVPIPNGCIMHDYWTTCIAASFGKIVDVSTPSILYRQHGRNACGGQALNVNGIIRQLKRIDRIKNSLSDKYRFASIFLARFRDKLSNDKVEMLEALSTFESKSWLGRRVILIKHSLYLNSIIRNVGLFVLC